MSKRVTLKEAQKLVKEYGMTIRKTSAGDYRINFKGGSEAYAVYKSTVKGALDTANHMYNQWMRRVRG